MVRADKERSSCRSVKFLQLLSFYVTIMLLENVTGGESCGG